MEYALITGASSGIGLELAKLFAQNGHHLILVARREDKLHALAKHITKHHPIDVQIIKKDLAETHAAVDIYDHCKEQNLVVHTLVNNAGVGSYGLFHESDLSSQLQMIHVNISSLTALTRLFIPEMIKRKQGKVLNVASTAAFQPCPFMAVYSATKSYVLSFSEAIGNELKNSGVTVTALCPGFTETEFGKRDGLQGVDVNKKYMMSASTVAKLGYRGLLRGKSTVITGTMNNVIVQANRLAPRRAAVNISRKVLESVGKK
ncbi:SDR family NAD(P)-dependent oxidoreductase [Longirhabdus pacifica]|uniref:SDR family NAD(P)-dependent oxidoreductase n=1 Tax=Longirhabdus pacifica TaxID=2305227 RepID=UPI00197FB819|nr:SDR family oxidoreductase [Longirhabdus pacifica]